MFWSVSLKVWQWVRVFEMESLSMLQTASVSASEMAWWLAWTSVKESLSPLRTG